MASATGIPDQNPETLVGHDEEEPLLGRPGDAKQQDGTPLWANVWIGELHPSSSSPYMS
jgi:hypothetical protein